MRPCAMPDCSKPAVSRGFCQMHYTRFKRHGDPSVSLRPGSGWVSSDGYHILHVEGREVRAHRLVVEELTGNKLTHGQLVHHKDRSEERRVGKECRCGWS